MTIYIVDLEAVDTRYTKEWKKYLPLQIKKHTNRKVEVISGGDTPQATTPGAFLNFGGTNVYKANQMTQIGKLFCDGKVKGAQTRWCPRCLRGSNRGAVGPVGRPRL